MTDSNYELLSQLGLLNIDGYTFEKSLGGESALSSLYTKGKDRIVIKFLISPRNDVERERFKLEYSVLNQNLLNRDTGANPLKEPRYFAGPITSYPLPTIAMKMKKLFSGMVLCFGYFYEEGTLLSDVDTDNYSLEKKFRLLHRVASGLSYFNQTGYTHRDLHPSNILLLEDHIMSTCNRELTENDSRVKFLDLGNCQSNTAPDLIALKIERDVKEELVFQDNNKRLLTSFTSMPPDFLEHGSATLNYDTWAFAVFAYKVIFGELPFDLRDIKDVTALRNNTSMLLRVKNKLRELDDGPRLVMQHLLSSEGKNRPETYAIVRLFSWIILRGDEFTDVKFIRKVIHNEGVDPYHNPLDDLY